LSFELARGLLEIERKYYKSNRRSGLFDAFENVFKKSFYKDKSDALDHAREKKKINEQILNQQLSLTGTK